MSLLHRVLMRVRLKMYGQDIMWEKADMQRTLLPGSRATYEKTFIEIEFYWWRQIFLMSLVPSFKKKTEWRTEICCEDGIPFANPHIMPAVHPSFHFMPTCQVYFHVLQILESSPMFKIHPEHITSFVMNFNIQTISPFKILILTLRLVHNTLLLPAAYSLAHVTLWRKYFVTNNIFRTVRATLCIFLIFATNQKAYMKATINIRRKLPWYYVDAIAIIKNKYEQLS